MIEVAVEGMTSHALEKPTAGPTATQTTTATHKRRSEPADPITPGARRNTSRPSPVSGRPFPATSHTDTRRSATRRGRRETSSRSTRQHATLGAYALTDRDPRASRGRADLRRTSSFRPTVMPVISATPPLPVNDEVVAESQLAGGAVVG